MLNNKSVYPIISPLYSHYCWFCTSIFHSCCHLIRCQPLFFSSCPGVRNDLTTIFSKLWTLCSAANRMKLKILISPFWTSWMDALLLDFAPSSSFSSPCQASTGGGAVGLAFSTGSEAFGPAFPADREGVRPASTGGIEIGIEWIKSGFTQVEYTYFFCLFGIIMQGLPILLTGRDQPPNKGWTPVR